MTLLERILYHEQNPNCFVSSEFRSAWAVFTLSDRDFQRQQLLRTKLGLAELRSADYHSYDWLKDVCREGK